MMNDESNKTDESALFITEMAGVEPLKSDNKIKHKKKPGKTPLAPVADDISLTISDTFSDAEISEDCPDILSFSRSGLQHNVLKKLRQGKNPIEHVLDLHGLTVDQARKATRPFAFLGNFRKGAAKGKYLRNYKPRSKRADTGDPEN